MAVLEFGPLSYCTMLIGVTLSTSLFNLSTLFGGVRQGYGLKKVQATGTSLFQKYGLKLALAVRKTISKSDRASQLIFSMIVANDLGGHGGLENYA